MSCFPCFRSQKSKSDQEEEEEDPPLEVKRPKPAGHQIAKSEDNFDFSSIKAQTFTFRELASATKNFRQECFLGEGGFGRVYRGTIPGSGQAVVVKQLDRNGKQGNREFLSEVATLSLLHHENLVNLIGYCADGDQRLLVYDYLSGGPVENHLFDIGPDRKPLDWIDRMKIACGVAQGLEYLHDTANPPIIHRDLKSANVILDENNNPKLSDFGLGKMGQPGNGDKINRMMGTYGYCAPEYTRTGELTVKSDVYSFGIVLLELITGRRALDTSKPNDEQNLVAWAKPKFRDPKQFPGMADPVIERKFPEKALNQAVALAAMCLQEEASVRPLMSDVVATLSFLMTVPDDPPKPANPDPPSPLPPEASRKSDADSDHEGSSSSGSSDDDSEESEEEEEEGDEDDEEEKISGSGRQDSRLFSRSSKHKKGGSSRGGSISSSSSHRSVSPGRGKGHARFDKSSSRSRSSSRMGSSRNSSGAFLSRNDSQESEDEDDKGDSVGSARSEDGGSEIRDQAEEEEENEE
ncbi:hypothetical protein SAY87_015943 [Trapa incisa]|uniref:Protein kinase domain-containing protein n=1 Tax=Trapa incisa TaxID=236973 RepID=A0AAN7QV22_9MYRT|nr:hypothetical protein SAY87_015943 [Trapa incisa]